LYFQAMLHYITGWRPNNQARARPPIGENRAPHQLEVASPGAPARELDQLLRAKSSISPQDGLDLKQLIRFFKADILSRLPVLFAHREVMAIAVAALLECSNFDLKYLVSYRINASDVLQIAAAIAGGDVSLAQAAHLKNLARPMRKQLLALLEFADVREEDLVRFAERWKRLAEKLHAAEFRSSFPIALTKLQQLRTKRRRDLGASEHRPVPSGTLLRAGAYVQLRAQLQSKPGEYVRYLDVLLRKDSDPHATLVQFALIADRIATPVLLQLIAHFKNRAQQCNGNAKANESLRCFLPKGLLAKAFVMRQKLVPIASTHSELVIKQAESALVSRFTKLAPLGRCYLDPRLSNFKAPFSQRSASKSLRTISRGSRLPLPDSDTLRFFLWWKNGKARTDIDLSAVFFDNGFNYLDVIAFYNIKNFAGHHSGDITDAPNGAAEFIDISKQKLRAKNVRYVLMSVNSYTQQAYCDLPQCFAGWMARAEPNSGEIFDARTVHDKIDLAGKSRIALPVLFDLEQNTAIWLDLSMTSAPRWNTVHGSLTGTAILIQGLSALPKANLFDLFSYHIQARGTLTSDPDGADVCFALDNGLTPFEQTAISANWMT
jgi:hypothetical protein